MLDKTRTSKYFKIFIPIVGIILIGGLILFFSLKNREPEQLMLKYGEPVPEALSIKETGGKDTLSFILSKGCSQCVKEFPLVKSIYDNLSSELNVVVYWADGSNDGLDVPESICVDLKGKYRINSGAFPQDFIMDKDGIVSFVNDSANTGRIASRIAEKYVTEDVKKNLLQYMSGLCGQDKVMFCFESAPMTDEFQKEYSSKYVFMQVAEFYSTGSTTDMIEDVGSFYKKALGVNTLTTYVTYAKDEESKWLTPTN